MGGPDSLGKVEPGTLADLVLFHADPRRDICNTAKTNAVFVNGRCVDRKTLDSLLVRAKRND